MYIDIKSEKENVVPKFRDYVQGEDLANYTIGFAMHEFGEQLKRKKRQERRRTIWTMLVFGFFASGLIVGLIYLFQR